MSQHYRNGKIQQVKPHTRTQTHLEVRRPAEVICIYIHIKGGTNKRWKRKVDTAYAPGGDAREEGLMCPPSLPYITDRAGA